MLTGRLRGLVVWMLWLWLLGCGLAWAATPYDLEVTAIPGLELKASVPYPLRVSLTVPAAGLRGTLWVVHGPSKSRVLVRDLELGPGQFVIWLYPRLEGGTVGLGSTTTVELHEGGRMVATRSLTMPMGGRSLTPLTVYWLSARDGRGTPRLFEGVDPRRSLNPYLDALGKALAQLLKEEAEKIRQELRENLPDPAQAELLAEKLKAVDEVEQDGVPLSDGGGGGRSGAIVDLFAGSNQFPRQHALMGLASMHLALRVDASTQTTEAMEAFFAPYESRVAWLLPDPASFGPSIRLSRFDEAARLPDSWLGYTPADLVVWDAGAPLDALSPDQQAALQGWVDGGGRLLVVGQPMEGVWHSPSQSLLPDLVPRWKKAVGPAAEEAAPTSQATQEGLTGWPSGTAVLMLTDREGALLGPGDGSDGGATLVRVSKAGEVYMPDLGTPRRLLYRRAVGFGVVDVLRVGYTDLASLPAADVATMLVGRSTLGPPHAVDLEQLRNLVMDRDGSGSGPELLTKEQTDYGMQVQYMARYRYDFDITLRERDAIALTKPIAGRLSMLVLIIVFTLVIGVADHLILRKLRREPLTWITAPLWIVLFSVLAWSLYGGFSRQNTPSRRVVFIDQSPTGTASRAEEWVTLRHSRPLDSVAVPTGAWVERRRANSSYYHGNMKYLGNRSDLLLHRMEPTGATVDCPGAKGSFAFLTVLHRADYPPCPYRVSIAPAEQGGDHRITVAKADGTQPIFGLVQLGNRVWALNDAQGDGQLRSAASSSVSALLLDASTSQTPEKQMAYLRLFDVLLAAERPRTQADSSWYSTMYMDYRRAFPSWGPAADLGRTVRDGRSALAILVDHDPQGNLRVWTQLQPAPPQPADTAAAPHEPPQVND